MSEAEVQRLCAHCGTLGERRLGHCAVCGEPVCAACGNIQYVRGERKAIHDACLGAAEAPGFSMIKFVK